MKNSKPILKSDINELKKAIDSYIQANNTSILLRGNSGRNKLFEDEGRILGTTSEEIFYEYKKGFATLKGSYNFKDILTHSVEFNVCNDGKFESILKCVTLPSRANESSSRTIVTSDVAPSTTTTQSAVTDFSSQPII